jgi:hypothetical protein
MRDTVWDGKTQKMVLPEVTAKGMKLVVLMWRDWMRRKCLRNWVNLKTFAAKWHYSRN